MSLFRNYRPGTCRALAGIIIWYIMIHGFPKVGVPLKHPFRLRNFHQPSSFWGYPHAFGKHPFGHHRFQSGWSWSSMTTGWQNGKAPKSWFPLNSGCLMTFRKLSLNHWCCSLCREWENDPIHNYIKNHSIPLFPTWRIIPLSNPGVVSLLSRVIIFISGWTNPSY